jgi:hypothetical protein
MMTFEQFQATRTPCDDLGAKLKDDRWKEACAMAAKGNVYLDCLYIEDVSDDRNLHANWSLQRDRDIETGDDLTALERKLYDWAVAEGYCDDTPTT